MNGKQHPIAATRLQALEIFKSLGFSVVAEREMETEWYNFDALNVAPDHPARDMQDTFFVDVPADPVQGRHVMRTHTTSVTARHLQQYAQSGKTDTFAVISSGKVFRNEATDVTHETQFFQIDGACVGVDVNISMLKGVLTEFYRRMLGDGVEIMLRPSFFPFVEPGLEVWVHFNGRKMEVMGAGMLHPNVLRNLGFDPDKVSGFAFGGGIDRIVMSKYQITDLRYLYQGDLRLNQW